MKQYLLTCPLGLEKITAKDISPFCSKVNIVNGGILFHCNKENMYKVNLYSRTGMHLLEKLNEFNVNNITDIYNEVNKISWSEMISPEDTLSIRARIRSKYFNNQNFVSLKIKDAIIDQIRSKYGKRPSIDRIEPTYPLFIYIENHTLKIFLNTSGKPLFMRGYKGKIHKTSLNEALAAGIIMMSGWRRTQPLYDPMCGSGTFPIEAALIGQEIPPGILRKHFTFQKWENFDNDIWKNLIENAKNEIKNYDLRISGYDSIKKNIQLSIENAKNIQVNEYIQFKSKNINQFNPSENGGVILINPPYGHRLGVVNELEKLYKLIGDVLKTNCTNNDAFIFTGNLNLAKFIGLRSKKRTILKNGTIDCRLLHFPIKTGKYA